MYLEPSGSANSGNKPPIVYVYSGGSVPRSVTYIRVHPSIESIPRSAFANLYQLQEIELHGDVKTIGPWAFLLCGVRMVHIPKNVVKIDMCAFSNCRQMFSIELPKNLRKVKECSLFSCPYLRNVAIPPKCKYSKEMLGPSKYMYKTSLGALFLSANKSRDKIIKALKHRFDGLPIHEICYYHSYRGAEEVLQDLKNADSPSGTEKTTRFSIRSRRGHELLGFSTMGKLQDCLGMTALHILACSTRHDLSVYEWILDKYPESLITKDKWGDLPILYAVWGSAPPEVVRLLVNSYKKLYPNHMLGWESMVDTLFHARAPLACIEKLFNIQQLSFAMNNVDWQVIVCHLAEYVHRLNTRRAGDENADALMEHIKLLLELSANKRLESLSNEKWRQDIETVMNKLPWQRYLVLRRVKMVYSKLASYEAIKESAFLLELAAWKSSISQSDSSITRSMCRVNCRVEAIVPNVLPYLLPETTPILYSREIPD